MQIIQSLKNLGIIERYESIESLAREGESISSEALMSILEYAQKEAAEGKVLSIEEVKKQIALWTKN
ncbi:MAG: hypothetical protein IPJ74_10790 [Saprospiraceae bacterium]|nr:hypothetical protein [Saprospiraceae bacterium]